MQHKLCSTWNRTMGLVLKTWRNVTCTTRDEKTALETALQIVANATNRETLTAAWYTWSRGMNPADKAKFAEACSARAAELPKNPWSRKWQPVWPESPDHSQEPEPPVADDDVIVKKEQS